MLWTSLQRSLPGLAIYALIGFMAARGTRSTRMGIVGGGAVALTDATVGWAVSWAIGPGAPDPGDRDAGLVILTALLVAATGAALGLLSGLAARRLAPTDAR